MIHPFFEFLQGQVFEFPSGIIAFESSLTMPSLLAIAIAVIG